MKRLRTLRRHVAKSLAKRGVVGTIHSSIRAVLVRISNCLPGKKRSITLRRKADLEFDRKYGVDTGGAVSLASLSIASDNWIHGNPYEAIGAVDFAEILGTLDAAAERFTFVDLGSGKGRAVLLAATLPFRRVVGVEISEELTSIARQNLIRFPAHERKCANVDLICMDAASYVLPDDPLILYMYNPFQGPVMARVVANVTASFRSRPRRIIVLYFLPRLAEMWDETKFLRKHRALGWATYDSGES